ncbi:MAG: class SAM-dependent methyltransferase [Solirubrobacterales bacterium]|nr:class SAM-dependent methyltransferase [Solirubrobacterales bacterium]
MTAPRTQAQVNRAAWRRPRLVAGYAHRRLLAPEAAILERHRDGLAGRVLELGSGAGRLTGHLIDVAQAVHGLDLMPEMVAHCRAAYPAATFEVGDLRDLSRFRDRAFDAVVAADNVLDVLDDQDRRDVLDQLHRILRQNGLLVMSSHNLAAAPQIPPPTHVRSPSRGQTVGNLVRLPLRLYNRRRLQPLEHRDTDHAVLNDVAHDYSLLHYYIGRDAQERQFADHGFVLIDCLDRDGAPVPPGARAPDSHWLHYVCRTVSAAA